jgi:hypothetical protein
MFSLLIIACLIHYAGHIKHKIDEVAVSVSGGIVKVDI